MKKDLEILSSRLLEASNQQETYTKIFHKATFEEDEFSNHEIEDLILLQHYQNFKLWHLEEKARNPEATDSEVANIKREIDKTNQKRNDFIEKIDEFIVIRIDRFVKARHKSELHSETPGSIIDRLSILNLKLYHMSKELGREDVTAMHRHIAYNKYSILYVQYNLLVTCFNVLIRDLLKGKKCFELYRQMKTYNDPEFNPEIYKRKKDENK